jgi:hypothetical protein
VDVSQLMLTLMNINKTPHSTDCNCAGEWSAKHPRTIQYL